MRKMVNVEKSDFRCVERISDCWKQEKTEQGVKFKFPVPERARGFYPYGFVKKNDSAADLAGWYGFVMRLVVERPAMSIGVVEKMPEAGTNLARAADADGPFKNRILPIRVRVDFADRESLSCEVKVPLGDQSHCLELAGKGYAVISLEVPLKDFPLETVREDYWQFVTDIAVECPDANIEVLYLAACRNRCVSVEMPIRGKSGEAGTTIVYEGIVHNCTPNPMAVQICQKYEGWEAAKAKIRRCPASVEEVKAQKQFGTSKNGAWSNKSEDDSIFLVPEYGSIRFRSEVTVPENLYPGGHEETILSVTARDGSRTDTVEVRIETLRALPHPYIYHNREGWKAVMERIRKYSCYEPAYQEYISTADAWDVHAPLEGKDYCYYTQEETGIMSAAYAYALTGERKYAEKIALFFRYFTDEENGYLARKKGCSQSYVQEGHFFQHLAIPYDIIADAGVLTAQEKMAVEKSFRLYMDILDGHIRSGQISNWLVSEIQGAFYCALAIQDIERAQRFVFGNGGLVEQFRHGIFSDGWWHECSVGYNTWVSSMMIHMARAFLPFGYNLLHTQFPIPCNQEVPASYPGRQTLIRSGMYNQKWGGNSKNSVCIKDMFDAVVPFLDYRCVLFGIADSDEKKLTGVHFGSVYDLAYYYYRDERYIPVILQCKPDPVFGNPEIDVLRNAVEASPRYAWQKSRSQDEVACAPQEKMGEYLTQSMEYHPESGMIRRGQNAPSIERNAAHLKMAILPDGEKMSTLPTEPYVSAHSDNIGIAMLRSQTPGREKREQIQAVLRYGSHGGAHGHFDIASLLSVMRYGRSFFNPENCWWGYAHFMYKFYVQCSLTKNMVVVDDKMQVPADSRLILFQTAGEEQKRIPDQEKKKVAALSGESWGAWAESSNERTVAIYEQESAPLSENTEGRSIEAAGIEVRTRWSYPPYGGMVYYQDGQKNDLKGLLERCKMNHCYLPVCDGETPSVTLPDGTQKEPVYGELNSFTEEILQRRVMAVADDYIVLFDYLEGENEHVYDSLMQLKGFRGITGEQVVPSMKENVVQWTAHTEQMDANPLSDAQFITDCNWYRADVPTVAYSEMIFTEEMSGERRICDRSNHNVPGILRLDVHTAWPHETEQMVGRVAVYDGWAADGDGYTVPLEYRVTAGGETLAEGAFDGWILGRGMIHKEFDGKIIENAEHEGQDAPLRGERALHLDSAENLIFTIKQGNSLDEVKREVITPQCIFWGEIVLTLDDGTRFDVGAWMLENAGTFDSEASERPSESVFCEDSSLHLDGCTDSPTQIHPAENKAAGGRCIRMENTDFGYGIGKDYKNGRVTIVGNEYVNAIPASTIDHGEEGHLILRLGGLLPEGRHVVALDACVGVDAFAGDEDQRRKTYAVRTRGKSARFVTVIEPYEEESVVQQVRSDTPDAVTVTLRDGTRQTVTVCGMENGEPKVLFGTIG